MTPDLFRPSVNDAWLCRQGGLAWRKGVHFERGQPFEVVYTHLWPANRCATCCADFTKQAAFNSKVKVVLSSLPALFLNEICQGKTGDALHAGIVILRNQG